MHFFGKYINSAIINLLIQSYFSLGSGVFFVTNVTLNKVKIIETDVNNFFFNDKTILQTNKISFRVGLNLSNIL